MTRLDRLEALAEKWKQRGLLARETKIALDALPNLIRVTRAAKALADHPDDHTYWLDLKEVLPPLFAEVES